MLSGLVCQVHNSPNLKQAAAFNTTSPPFDGEGGRAVDLGIRREVEILWGNGIETTESCEGGPGHSFPEPTVRFVGPYSDGFRALAIALQHGLKVSELRRIWVVSPHGEPTGPHWEMTFSR